MNTVVRTDNLDGTDVRADLVSVRYMGADGETPTDIENGNVLKLGAIETGNREVFIGGAVAADDNISDIVLIASPEVNYEDGKYNLSDYINKAGKVCRGYHLPAGASFSITKEGFVGATAAKGNLVELAAGTKLKAVAAATSGSTVIGRIIDVENAGRYTYYVIKLG